MGSVVLVTGASRYLGGRAVRQLAGEPWVSRVVAVDVVPPPHDLGGAEFVRADIRAPVISKVISECGADTVVHMGVISTPRQAGGRESMKEINVIGTMQLLAACQRSEAVRTLVVKSTSSVYGAGPRDPAMFTEDMVAKHPPSSGWAKDSVDVEGYVRGFARRRPDVGVTLLRLANIIGPRIQTAVTDYLSLPLIPTVLGFDARLQFLHEDDSIEVIRVAAAGRHPGTFNVAGDGIMTLSQAVRRLGRPMVPVPAALLSTAGRALGGHVDLRGDQVRFLTYGRGIDTTRFAGWGVPVRTTVEAFDDFARSTRDDGPVLRPVALGGAA